MDARWQNLILFFILIAVAWFAWQWLQTNPVQIQATPQPTPAGPIDSFEKANAVVFAVLSSYSWFDATDQSIRNPTPPGLNQASAELQSVRVQIQSGSSFEEQAAALALLDAWIARLELESTWSQMKSQAESIQFSESTPLRELCDQRTNWLELKIQAQQTQQNVMNAQETHNSFVTGFSTLALSAGFEREIFLQDQFGVSRNLENWVDQLAEECH